MARIIILSILFVISLISCTNKQKTFYDNGNIKEEYWVKNNKKNGIYKTYYKNGNIKEQHIFELDKKIDSSLVFYHKHPNVIKEKTKYIKDNDTLHISVYYTNGVLYNHGKVLPNGNKYGWWELYTYKGELEGELEYLDIDNSEYLNRTMFYNSNGFINSEKSNYYLLHVDKDTVKINESLKITIELKEPFFSYNSDCFVIKPSPKSKPFYETFSNLASVELDTTRSINKDLNIQQETIPNDIATNRIFVFGLRYSTLGVKNIRGIIVELESNDNKPMSDCKDCMRYLYFDKTIIVVE